MSVSNPYRMLCPGVPDEQIHLCWVLKRLFIEGLQGGSYTPFTDYSRHESAATLNNLRSYYSTRNNISDMRIVNWDRELEHWAYFLVAQKTPIPDMLRRTRDDTMVFDPRFQCQRTEKYFFDYFLVMKTFNTSNQRKSTKSRKTTTPAIMLRSRKEAPTDGNMTEVEAYLRYESTQNAHRLFVKIIDNIKQEQFSDIQVIESSHDNNASMLRMLVWAYLDNFGCAMMNRRFTFNDRLDLACYFGSTTVMPRAFDHRPFERGMPCENCPERTRCNIHFKGVCGDMKPVGYPTEQWHTNFWHETKYASVGNNKSASKKYIIVLVLLLYFKYIQ